jgi:hypothetical protein
LNQIRCVQIDKSLDTVCGYLQAKAQDWEKLVEEASKGDELKRLMEDDSSKLEAIDAAARQNKRKQQEAVSPEPVAKKKKTKKASKPAVVAAPPPPSPSPKAPAVQQLMGEFLRRRAVNPAVPAPADPAAGAELDAVLLEPPAAAGDVVPPRPPVAEAAAAAAAAAAAPAPQQARPPMGTNPPSDEAKEFYDLVAHKNSNNTLAWKHFYIARANLGGDRMKAREDEGKVYVMCVW